MKPQYHTLKSKIIPKRFIGNNSLHFIIACTILSLHILCLSAFLFTPLESFSQHKKTKHLEDFFTKIKADSTALYHFFESMPKGGDIHHHAHGSVYAEEVFLREKFGNNYLNWAEKTPVFIPNKLSYVHPIMAFDWEKIIIKEKTGLLMLFLVFFGFQLFSEFIITNFLVVEFNFISYGTIFSFVFYMLVKTMQTRKILSVE